MNWLIAALVGVMLWALIIFGWHSLFTAVFR
jgi:hypothetical protein